MATIVKGDVHTTTAMQLLLMCDRMHLFDYAAQYTSLCHGICESIAVV